MKQINIGLLISISCITASAWGADDLATSDTSATSTTTSQEVLPGHLKNETLGLRPLAGVMILRDQTGTQTARGALGLGVEYNITPSISMDIANAYFGISTGLIYSHLGDPSSNFVGTNAAISTGASNANLALIPLDLKVGYNFTDYFRLSAHGGGNLTYRSIASSLNFGPSSAVPGATWNVFPNIGADAEVALGKNVALTLRPDWTISPVNSLFTGTLALDIFLS